MSVFVLSTMTQSVGYTTWKTVDGVPIQLGKIMIHGGAGIPSLRSGFGDVQANGEGQPVWTAQGIVTSLSDAQYEALKGHKVFNQHVEEGLLKVISRDISKNHDDVKKYAESMSSDAFRVLNKSTLNQKIKVTTATIEAESEFRL